MAKKKKTIKQQLGDIQNKLNNYGKYKYEDKGLKKGWKAAQKAYNKMLDNPANYGYGQYDDEVDALFQQVMNPEAFSYDMSKDKLFQMYKQQYNTAGTRAMRNAMGVGAARSGGANSSASQSAAQTTFLGYMDALNAKAADTYANALSRYQQKQNELLNRYNIANDMNNASNNAYYQQLGLASQRLANAQNAYFADDDRQYRSWSDQRSLLQTQANNLQAQINNNNLYNLKKKNYTGG